VRRQIIKKDQSKYASSAKIHKLDKGEIALPIKWDFVTVGYRLEDSSLELQTSDQDIIDNVRKELAKLLPNRVIKVVSQQYNLFAKVPSPRHIELSDKPDFILMYVSGSIEDSGSIENIGSWAVRYFLDRGWEPYGFTVIRIRTETLQYFQSFRKSTIIQIET